MIDEEENNEIRKMLRNLPAMKAGDDFLEKLNKRIAVLGSESESSKPVRFENEKKGVFEKLIGGIRNAWLVPALGLSAAVIFVFYITFMNKDENINEQKITDNKTEVKPEPGNTTENTTPTEIPPPAVPENSEKKTESGKQSEKDMTGDYDYKKSEKLPVRVEQNNKSLDQDKVATKEPRLKVAIPEGIIKENENEQSEKKSDDMNNEGGNMMEKSRISSNEKKKMEDKSMKTPGEKMEEFEKSIQKSIMDKLNAVNKANLENLRDKVNE